VKGILIQNIQILQCKFSQQNRQFFFVVLRKTLKVRLILFSGDYKTAKKFERKKMKFPSKINFKIDYFFNNYLKTKGLLISNADIKYLIIN